MTDDFSDDVLTTGVLSANGSASGVFEVDDDTDWFRLEVEKYKTYYIEPSLLSIGTALFDSQGQPLYNPKFSGIWFLAPSSDFIFVAATEPVGHRRLTDYSLESIVPDDDYTNFFSRRDAPVRAVDQYSVIGGIIEAEYDRDIMSYMFAKDTQVTLTVHGADSSDATLVDPIVSVYRIEGANLDRLATDNNSGPGRSAQVLFQTPEAGLVYIDVNAVAGGTGSYHVAIDVKDDFSKTRQTTGRLKPILNSISTSSTNGTLETLGDIDAFRIKVIAGNWYNIHSDPSATPRITVMNANWERVNQPPIYSAPESLKNQGFFYADTSADYLVWIENHGRASGSNLLLLGDYTLSVDARQPSISTVDLMSNSAGGSGAFHYESNFEFDSFQFFSEKHLKGTQGELLAPKKMHQFDTTLTPRVTVPAGTQGSSDIWVRAHEPVSSKWTSWKKIELLGVPVTKSTGVRRGLHVGTYAFADALPAYFDGDPDLNGFEVFSVEERQAFRQALRSWNIRDIENPENSLTEVAPGPDNDAAEIMLFKSNLSQHVYVVPNDWDGFETSLKRADFVIDSDSQAMQDLTPGSQGFFEMLRGVGQLFGLREYTNNRSISVMGERFGPDVDHLPWANTPLPVDFKFASPFKSRPISGEEPPNEYAIFTTNPGDDRYRFQDGVVNYSTIMDSGGEDWISAAGVNLATTIDLRSATPSYTGINGKQWQNMLIAYNTVIENAVGGNHYDHLSGNRFSNLLIGNSGNDILNGRAGNDRLYGGNGSDRYVFELGDGHDTINEQESGGLDQLKVVGFQSLDKLDDFTFQRLGNDLLVRFQLDGNSGHIEDSIRIRNMGSPRSRVEQFSLDNIHGNNLFSASLVSVFANSTQQPQRFRLAEGTDRFGALVAPI